ncbi:MAG: DUF805 domain-containing protein [Gemmatimonas sp.]|nr:DUF805 domain-containing protein [Gemmatimonas sp.]
MTEATSASKDPTSFVGPYPFTAIQAVRRGFSKFNVFSGRATRSEFWYWLLFTYIVNLLVTLIAVQFLMGVDRKPAERRDFVDGLSTLVGLIFMLPSIAVQTRRLHDVNRSGWSALLCLTVIGVVPYVYWLSSRGDDFTNSYGDPSSP